MNHGMEERNKFETVSVSVWHFRLSNINVNIENVKEKQRILGKWPVAGYGHVEIE